MTERTPLNWLHTTFTPVRRAEGITGAERYLQRLCETSFLRLWSYPGVYRDQGLATRREGKEVCDLLVVFGDHTIIFSDKDCAFPDSGNLEQDWTRWFRKAVMKSAEQIWGAERWILDHPDRLYLDRTCTERFPLTLPSRDRAVVHRVVVAHGVSERCQAAVGGTGSLILSPMITGARHISYPAEPVLPFTVGDLDPDRGFVHVLDDHSLEVVLGTLDTISDFVAYLNAKARYLRSGSVLSVAGEDDLLAVYLTSGGPDGHAFPTHEAVDGMAIIEGHWDAFQQDPRRLRQLDANAVSYVWDALIEEFNQHILGGTSEYRSHPEVADIEPLLRAMAAENRTRRRHLAQSLLSVMQKPIPAPRRMHNVRVVATGAANLPYYVFLVMPPRPGTTPAEYREERRALLHAYVLVTQYLNPTAKQVIGIATEPMSAGGIRSEDVLGIESKDWTTAMAREARRFHEELGLLSTVEQSTYTIHEYPDAGTPGTPSRPPSVGRHALPGNMRNQPCACGSGKKYKRCCGP